MTRLLLVRHAAAVVDPSRAPGEWPLSAAGAEDARKLGRGLSAANAAGPPEVWASTEQKAIETASLVFGSNVRVDPRLGEVSKPWYESSEEHEEAVRRYLRGVALAGWEPQRDAIARFADAIAECRDDSSTAFVSHGTVMSLWLSTVVRGLDAARFWDQLAFPDAHLVTIERGEAEIARRR